MLQHSRHKSLQNVEHKMSVNAAKSFTRCADPEPVPAQHVAAAPVDRKWKNYIKRCARTQNTQIDCLQSKKVLIGTHNMSPYCRNSDILPPASTAECNSQHVSPPQDYQPRQLLSAYAKPINKLFTTKLHSKIKTPLHSLAQLTPYILCTLNTDTSTLT